MFRNETKEWYHVFVDGKNPLQKQAFYTVGESFVKAEDLKISDKLLLSSRKCVTIEEIQVEQLSKPETTYNFEVADFHTYYVSESNVLVHNDCTNYQRKKAVKQAWAREREMVAKTGQGTRRWSGKQRMELLKTGKVKGFEGHHINSVNGHPSLAGNLKNIRFVTRKQHLALHNGNWRNVTTGSLLG